MKGLLKTGIIMMLILPLLGSCASFKAGVKDGWNNKKTTEKK
jgi:hypothetical protein